MPANHRRLWISAAAVAAVAIVSHLPSLGYGFVFDEQILIADNPAVTQFDLHRIFTEKFWPGPARGLYYRPIVTLSYAAAYAFVGPAPWLHHLLSLVFHAGAAMALFLLARRLLGQPGLALAVGLLFAALPAHVESVAWVPGRTDVLCAGFVAGAWLAVLRGRESARRPAWLAAAAGLFLLGLGSKEVAITLPAFLLLQDFSAGRSKKKPAVDYVILAVVAAAFLAWRAWVLAVPGPEPAPPALAGMSLASRALAVAAIPGLAAVKILLPLPWRIDYAYDWVARSVVVAPLALLALGLAGAAVAGFIRRRPWGLPLACFFLAMAPVMHFVAFPNYFAERFLYLPSFFLLTALAAAGLALSPGRTTRAALALVVLAMIGLSWAQAQPFKDDLTFWQAAVRQRPDLASAHNWLGTALLKRKELGRAESEFRTAIRLDPGYSVAGMNLATVLSRSRPAEAENILIKLIEADPGNPDLHANLALVYLGENKTEQARAEFRILERLDARHPSLRKLRYFLE